MKSPRLFVCAAVLVVLAGPAQAGLINTGSDPSLTGSTVITFDTIPQQSFSSLTIGNATFSVPAGQLGYISNAYAGQYNTTGQSLQNTYSTQAFNQLTITFASPVSAFGFNWGAADFQWTLTAFDSGNHLLASRLLPITAASNSGNFYGLSSAGISKVVLTQPGSGDYIFIDNFRYVSGARIQGVPEPGSLVLFTVGFAGVLGHVWRRRRKTAPAPGLNPVP